MSYCVIQVIVPLRDGLSIIRLVPMATASTLQQVRYLQLLIRLAICFHLRLFWNFMYIYYLLFY